MSVVVSAYNRPAFLNEAIASVRAQTYRNLEILVQDDSTDLACKDTVNSVVDTRIAYTRNDPPLGTLANLRAGYRRCTGKYFCTLNDDDRMHEEYIQRMVKAMESNERYSVAFSDHYIINGDGKVDNEATERNTKTWGRDVLPPGCVSRPIETAIVAKSVPGMFALFRKSRLNLDDFPDEVSSGYDYWLVYLAVRGGDQIYYDRARLTYYRVHPGSQTATFANAETRLRSLRYGAFVHERLLADPRLLDVRPVLRARLALVYRLSAAALMSIQGERKSSFLYLIRSLRLALSAKSFIGLVLWCLPSPITKMFFAASVLAKGFYSKRRQEFLGKLA